MTTPISNETSFSQSKVSDFDKDGKLDLWGVAGVGARLRVVVLRGRGDGTFLPPLGFIGTTLGLLILFVSMHVGDETLKLGALAFALTSRVCALLGVAWSWVPGVVAACVLAGYPVSFWLRRVFPPS